MFFTIVIITEINNIHKFLILIRYYNYSQDAIFASIFLRFQIRFHTKD